MIPVRLLLLNWNLFHLVRGSIEIQPSTTFCSLFKNNLDDETAIMYIAMSVYKYLQGRWFFVNWVLISVTVSLFEVSLAWIWLAMSEYGLLYLIAFCKILGAVLQKCLDAKDN